MSVEIKDCTLWCETRGRGKPLVLIHGFGSDHHSWDGLFERLSATHLVVRYDLRGFGASLDRCNYSFSHAADLEGLLNGLNIGRCDVLGVSMGGAIATNFALRAPARVDRLILESPALIGWEWSEAWRIIWRQVVKAARAGNLDEARHLWWMHPMFETTRALPEPARKLWSTIEAYSCIHWAKGDRQEDVLIPDIERLNQLAAPTLLLTGEKDFADLRLVADVIVAAAPHVTRIDYEDAGHMLHLERPERFLKDVAAFLG
jgi:pimeloyl-ACP methyl ester carboxylesterase